MRHRLIILSRQGLESHLTWSPWLRTKQIFPQKPGEGRSRLLQAYQQ